MCRQGSGSMSLAPTPRLASLSHSLDEGSDNGRHSDLDSPFDLSLARYCIYACIPFSSSQV